MELIKPEIIAARIFTVRGVQVMFDSDLAALYQVETKVLNQAVKRNIERFPETFRFQLTQEEFKYVRAQWMTLEDKGEFLRSQIVTLEDKHNSQYEPIEVKSFSNSHDRFLIIDKKELYHLGASLKDLGKKWFGFSKMDSLTTDVLAKLNRAT
jgi:hypothetical protein